MAVWVRLLLIIGIVGSQKRNFQFVFDKIKIEHWVPELIDQLNHTLIQLNNRSFISGHLILKRNIERLNLNTTLDFWKSENKKRRMYSFQMDACRFLNVFHKNRILSIYAKSFMKYTNGTIKCPLKAHFNYTLNNWFLDEQEFPIYAPEGTFQTITEYLIQKKLIIRVFAKGRVVY